VSDYSRASDRQQRTLGRQQSDDTSDQYAISVNINTPDYDHVYATRRQPQCKYRWDRANLPQHQSLCSEMLDQLRLPTEALLCLNNTGRSPVGRRPTDVAHSKIARVARIVFVLYVVGRAY